MDTASWKPTNGNIFVAVIGRLQELFFRNFVQAHLLTTLKKNSNRAVDSRNWTLNLEIHTNSNNFVSSVDRLQELFFLHFTQTHFYWGHFERISMKIIMFLFIPIVEGRKSGHPKIVEHATFCRRKSGHRTLLELIFAVPSRHDLRPSVT